MGTQLTIRFVQSLLYTRHQFTLLCRSHDCTVLRGKGSPNRISYLENPSGVQKSRTSTPAM